VWNLVGLMTHFCDALGSTLERLAMISAKCPPLGAFRKAPTTPRGPAHHCYHGASNAYRLAQLLGRADPPASAAARKSLRHLCLLFEQTGASFVQPVASQRAPHYRAALTSPTDVGLGWGFNSVLPPTSHSRKSSGCLWQCCTRWAAGHGDCLESQHLLLFSYAMGCCVALNERTVAGGPVLGSPRACATSTEVPRLSDGSFP
jgi:hypothetical protein